MTPNAAPTPIIGIPASFRRFNGMRVHGVGSSNVDAVANVSGGIPVLIPAIGDRVDARGVLSGIDGLMLTGGATNIEPHHYGGPPPRAGDDHDPARDATSLPLIRAAIDMGMPVFAICRGFQEFNVALGGTLHQFLHEVAGRFDHRRDRTKPIAAQMAPIHGIAVSGGAALEDILGAREAKVNSLHGQGVDGIAPGMTVEALAPDTTVEALSVNAAHAFALGVQWHPEFSAEDDPVSRALFEAFGEAARERALGRCSNGNGQ